MGGVITIDITITGGQLRKVFEFTENLPPARDGDLQKHVIALDTFRDSMIWCETDSYVLNHNYTERSLILGKRSKYTVPFTNIILTESREYVGAEYGRQLITNISTGERFIRTGIYDPIQNALVNVGESTFKYSYNQNTISKILASDTSVSDTVYVTGGIDNIGCFKKNSDKDVSVFSISPQGVLQGTLDSSGNLKLIQMYDKWQKYYYLVLDYYDDGNRITDITNKVVIWQKTNKGTYCGDVSTQLTPSNFYTFLQYMHTKHRRYLLNLCH